jgi:hypothetical protein
VTRSQIVDKGMITTTLSGGCIGDSTLGPGWEIRRPTRITVMLDGSISFGGSRMGTRVERRDAWQDFGHLLATGIMEPSGVNSYGRKHTVHDREEWPLDCPNDDDAAPGPVNSKLLWQERFKSRTLIMFAQENVPHKTYSFQPLTRPP